MPDFPVRPLALDDLVTNAGTQSRVGFSEDTIDEYAEVLEETGDWPFPPLVVFHDGVRYLLSAGFHRAGAARLAGRTQVPCEIRQGSVLDALIFGMRDNHEHGLRPTPFDRQKNVISLLDSGKDLTHAQIAALAGVGIRTVGRIVAGRKAAVQTPENRPLADSGEPDPFDPFDVGESDSTAVPDRDSGEGEDGRRDAEGREAPRETAPPAATRKGRDALAGRRKGKESPPDDRLAIQRSKTVKTAEALMRAFDDLQALKKGSEHERAIAACKRLVQAARNW